MANRHIQRWRISLFIRGMQIQTRRGLTLHFLSWLQQRSGIGEEVERLKSSAADNGKVKQNRPRGLLCSLSRHEQVVIPSWIYTQKHLKTVYMETYAPIFTDALFPEGQELLQCPSADEEWKDHCTAGRGPEKDYTRKPDASQKHPGPRGQTGFILFIGDFHERKSLEKADCWSPRNRVYGMRRGMWSRCSNVMTVLQICDYIRRVDYLFGSESFIMTGQILNTKEGIHRMSVCLGQFPATCEVY